MFSIPSALATSKICSINFLLGPFFMLKISRSPECPFLHPILIRCPLHTGSSSVTSSLCLSSVCWCLSTPPTLSPLKFTTTWCTHTALPIHLQSTEIGSCLSASITLWSPTITSSPNPMACPSNSIGSFVPLLLSETSVPHPPPGTAPHIAPGLPSFVPILSMGYLQ